MKHKEFTERWVVNLLESIDANLDEDDKVRMMESCGRACAREGSVDEAKACHGDLDKLLEKLKKWVGKDNVRRKGNEIALTYTKCYCRLVADGPKRLPNTYCYCSQGWLKEMFETVTGRPVYVELRTSIKRGAKGCRFTVRI